MMVDLPRKIPILFLGGLEYHFRAIGEFVRGEVDLAEAAFTDKSIESVIANSVEIVGTELVQKGLIGVGELSVVARVSDEIDRSKTSNSSPYGDVALLHTLHST